LTAYQLLTLDTNVLGIAFDGGGAVETATVAIVRRKEAGAAGQRERGCESMLKMKMKMK